MKDTSYYINQLSKGKKIDTDFPDVDSKMLSIAQDASDLNLSITKLASKCGMDIRTMSNIMNGNSQPTKDHILAICIVLKYDIVKTQDLLKTFDSALHIAHRERDKMIANEIATADPSLDGEDVLIHIDCDVLIPNGHTPITNQMKHQIKKKML